MGKEIINGIEYSGCGANNASELPYDNTTSTKEKIDELNSKLKPTLLWKNNNYRTNYPNQFADFDTQTLTIDLSKYDEVIITHGLYSKENTKSSRFIKNSDYKYQLEIAWVGNSNFKISQSFRPFTITDNGIVFDDCMFATPYYDSATKNAYCIPFEIYGVKWS